MICVPNVVHCITHDYVHAGALSDTMKLKQRMRTRYIHMYPSAVIIFLNFVPVPVLDPASVAAVLILADSRSP